MIKADMVNTTDFAGREGAETSFRGWCRTVGIPRGDFPFTVKTGKLHKGKEIIFKVVSWGCYEASFGGWVIFMAYRFPAAKHTVQYSWHANEFGMIDGETQKNEWIGA
jgi:hypothetical protein